MTPVPRFTALRGQRVRVLERLRIHCESMRVLLSAIKPVRLLVIIITIIIIMIIIITVWVITSTRHGCWRWRHHTAATGYTHCHCQTVDYASSRWQCHTHRGRASTGRQHLWAASVSLWSIGRCQRSTRSLVQRGHRPISTTSRANWPHLASTVCSQHSCSQRTVRFSQVRRQEARRTDPHTLAERQEHHLGRHRHGQWRSRTCQWRRHRLVGQRRRR